MNYIIDEHFRKNVHAGFERDKREPINTIVIHGTMGGGTYEWMKQGHRDAEYKRGVGLFHFLIEKSGRIVEIVSPTRWVYSSSSGKMDRFTVNIELEKYGPRNAQDITEEQFRALVYLTKSLKATFPTIDTIESHDRRRKIYSHQEPKPCPGKFPWDRFSEEIGFEKVEAECLKLSVTK